MVNLANPVPQLHGCPTLARATPLMAVKWTVIWGAAPANLAIPVPELFWRLQSNRKLGFQEETNRQHTTDTHTDSVIIILVNTVNFIQYNQCKKHLERWLNCLYFSLSPCSWLQPFLGSSPDPTSEVAGGREEQGKGKKDFAIFASIFALQFLTQTFKIYNILQTYYLWLKSFTSKSVLFIASSVYRVYCIARIRCI